MTAETGGAAKPADGITGEKSNTPINIVFSVLFGIEEREQCHIFGIFSAIKSADRSRKPPPPGIQDRQPPQNRKKHPEKIPKKAKFDHINMI